jgi:predicted aconitase with swiveling domain
VHTVVSALGSCTHSYISVCELSELTDASIGLCAIRGATDGKLVLIHDVHSYIYTTASPVAVVLAEAEPMVAC